MGTCTLSVTRVQIRAHLGVSAHHSSDVADLLLDVISVDCVQYHVCVPTRLSALIDQMLLTPSHKLSSDQAPAS